jgi:trehalose synthase
MSDADENVAMVNALQRHAAVVVQKSLREGFGLTVTEAMWKGRPIVASAVGGISDQIRDGIEGLLVRDPTNPDETAAAIARMLDDHDLACRLGDAAHKRAVDEYLAIGSLERWADLVRSLVVGAPA